jgi:hypothetical protein
LNCIIHRGMLAFYTCFFGADNNERNFIPPVPSLSHACYYYTNNDRTMDRLMNTGWIPVRLEKPNLDSVMLAKWVKSCPHMLPELRSFTATCYFDSALALNGDEVVTLATHMVKYSSYHVCMARHPFISKTWPPSAYSEWREASLQPRYAEKADVYCEYIREQVESGLKDTDDIHFATGFIIRRNNAVCRAMGEVWWAHICRTGILCQLSFFFVQQMFRQHIFDIEFGVYFRRWGY